jgi:hypothetical protein
MIANLELVEYKSDDVDVAIMINSVTGNKTLDNEWERYVSLSAI